MFYVIMFRGRERVGAVSAHRSPVTAVAYQAKRNRGLDAGSLVSYRVERDGGEPLSDQELQDARDAAGLT